MSENTENTENTENIEGQVTVENVIDSAIVAGFENATVGYMAQLEEALQQHTIIQEAGDAQILLQTMIDTESSDSNEDIAQESYEDLQAKMSIFLNK